MCSTRPLHSCYSIHKPSISQAQEAEQVGSSEHPSNQELSSSAVAMIIVGCLPEQGVVGMIGELVRVMETAVVPELTVEVDAVWEMAV